MKAIDVRFTNGREALRSYWGHLHGGGLSFPHDPLLQEGQAVDLNIHIASQPLLTVRGRVIRQHSERTFVAFDDRGGQDRLLRAAASDDPIEREAVESALRDT